MRHTSALLACLIAAACANRGVPAGSGDRLRVVRFVPPVHGSVPCDAHNVPEMGGPYWCHLVRLEPGPRYGRPMPAEEGAPQPARVARAMPKPRPAPRRADPAPLLLSAPPSTVAAMFQIIPPANALPTSARHASAVAPLPETAAPYGRAGVWWWMAAGCAFAIALLLMVWPAYPGTRRDPSDTAVPS